MKNFLFVLVAIIVWGCSNKITSSIPGNNQQAETTALNKENSNADFKKLLSLYSPQNEFPLNISLVNLDNIWKDEDGNEKIGYRLPAEYEGHYIPSNLWYLFTNTNYPEEDDYYAIKYIPLGPNLVGLLTRMPYGWSDHKVILFVFDSQKKVFINKGIEAADYVGQEFDSQDPGITTSLLNKNKNTYTLEVTHSRANYQDSPDGEIVIEFLKVFQFTGRDFILIKDGTHEKSKKE